MKKLVALMIPLPLVVGLLAACSSDDTAQPGTDASTDVTSDKKVPPTDAPVVDAGPGCVPGDISTFTPTWIPPNDPQPTACTDTQINDYFA